MSTNATVTRVWEIAGPLVQEEGMEILEIELRHEGRSNGKVLRFFLDKEGGPNLDDLTRVSRRLSDLLDTTDALEGSYTLEVSSPGVNRILKKPEHYVRYVGKRVRVRTRETICGRRSFLGLLQDVREDGIILMQEGSEFRIPLAAIEKANYEHDWSA
ncbi:MAG: ribosome maturation factor RimP [Deltaproteobacteria bacterium]|nr:ribosome maturation factor RimP [Deltaproteobacteria bacterium]